MSDRWINQEWNDVCNRLQRCAESHDSTTLKNRAEQFADQPPPESYQEVLNRVSDAANLAIGLLENEKDAKREPFDPKHGIVDAIDEGVMESFPASDPSTKY
ncbi:MAG: hypothetical protein KDB00_25870 [Planctomycetales bacterium]|nr:hypothetical protein [Planctomycetales bacterium]